LLYEVVIAYRETGICPDYRLFYDVVWKQITGVYSEDIFEIAENEMKSHSLLTNNTVIFEYDDCSLRVRGRPNILLIPDARANCYNDCSQIFALDILNRKIVTIRFDSNSRHLEGLSFREAPIIILDLDDDTMIYITLDIDDEHYLVKRVLKNTILKTRTITDYQSPQKPSL
jgi:hypothetical protein